MKVEKSAWNNLNFEHLNFYRKDFTHILKGILIGIHTIIFSLKATKVKISQCIF